MYQIIGLIALALFIFSNRLSAQTISDEKQAFEVLKNIHNGNVILDYSVPIAGEVSLFMLRDSIGFIFFEKNKPRSKGVYSMEVSKSLLRTDTTQFYYTLGKDTLQGIYIKD